MEDNKNEIKIVKCNSCASEIPETVAMTMEGLEYVMYFCGQACFDHWESEHQESNK
jgi:hypothetical protein